MVLGASRPRPRVLVLTPWYPDDAFPAEGPLSELRISGAFVGQHARSVLGRADPVLVHLEPWPWVGYRVFRIRDEGVVGGLRTIRVRYRRTRVPGLGSVAQMLGLLRVLGTLRSEGWRPDIVHPHVFSAGAFAVALGWLLRAPTVLTEHFTRLRGAEVDAWTLRVAAWVLRSMTLVTPTSHELEGQLLSIEPKMRSRVIDNPVDVTAFRPAPFVQRESEAPLRLIAAGRLVEVKGMQFLLPALRQVVDAGIAVSLTIVGDGPKRAELERQCDDLDLREVVVFHGVAAHAQVAELMREADVFVLPSTNENLPNVVIEALASGLPVIGTRIAGVPEMLDATNGMLVEPRDEVGLAAAITSVARDYATYDREAIAQAAVQRYSLEAVGVQWDEIYSRLLALPAA
ncbi:unannotated protein [freshwater metagenome]|uniref:Unannotated protein n=1 Tax=freshwater metagenome TaxID=449393 RepID=A0A6J7DBY6_9ZZZZ|nr:glycosyltransferase [Actinomycetota bacterium]